MIESRRQLAWSRAFGGVYGCFLGLALLKFGNPVVLDRLVDPPREFWEFVFQPWPVRWGYLMLFGCLVFGIAANWDGPRVPKWVIGLPIAWFGWQLLSAPSSISPALTQATLLDFGACLACLFIGMFCLSGSKTLIPFWIGILGAFLLVIWMGFEQHYGGLEATRQMFFQQPEWQKYPPEYIKKIQSNRIFSTLVYPNALAASVILLLPALLHATWGLTKRLTEITRGVLVGCLAYGALACLFWSASKAGWLVGLGLLLVAILRQPFSKSVRVTIVSIVVVLGLVTFFVKFAAYFHRGAPSVSARVEYWRAATQTALHNPVLGTGPGTFSAAFRKIKTPEAEMAQLTHNDYLEQASDSGVLGCVTYSFFILGSVVLLARRQRIWKNQAYFLIWLGLLGWAAQSFVEFLLYIPALAWPAFTFLGLLWARASAEQYRGNASKRPIISSAAAVILPASSL